MAPCWWLIFIISGVAAGQAGVVCYLTVRVSTVVPGRESSAELSQETPTVQAPHPLPPPSHTPGSSGLQVVRAVCSCLLSTLIVTSLFQNV